MMKKKYDLVFGIGAACSCSQMLRKTGLQFSSYPFDWLYGTDFSGRVDILTNDFKDFVNKEDLTFINATNGDKDNPCDVYNNVKNGITFNHDFPQGVPLEQSYPAVKAKYDRRIDRLLKRIERSENTLIVYVEIPTSPENTTLETLLNCREKLCAGSEKKISTCCMSPARTNAKTTFSATIFAKSRSITEKRTERRRTTPAFCVMPSKATVFAVPFPFELKIKSTV